jgi:CII-binding regulator of phage lambda lysogenization HflD
MGRMVLVVLLLAGVGAGAYFLLRPKPAYDISRIEDSMATLERQLEGKRPMLEQLAAGAEALPPQLAAMETYFQELGAVLDAYVDCGQAVEDMRALSARFRAGAAGLDQRALAQQLAGMNRNDQAALSAKLALSFSDGLGELLPRVKQFCRQCPEESAVFYEVLEGVAN